MFSLVQMHKNELLFVNFQNTLLKRMHVSMNLCQVIYELDN